MESEKHMPEFSGATIQKAFAALEEYLVSRDGQGQASMEQQTMMPPASEESNVYVKPLSLSLVERMHLEAALLKTPYLREDAAESLVELAESVDCTLPAARRILDILEYENNECEGALSPQVRKAKKALERLAGYPCFSNSKDDLQMEKRDTLPFILRKPELPPVPAKQKDSLNLHRKE